MTPPPTRPRTFLVGIVELAIVVEVNIWSFLGQRNDRIRIDIFHIYSIEGKKKRKEILR